MDRIEVADAKIVLEELVDRAEAGETIEILRHGRPAALLAQPKQALRPVDVEALRALTPRSPRQEEPMTMTIRELRDSHRY
jgi:antitoxin (DNA-binding transcriptional repressor) of toxin-antitoxin stability system